jgi:hypothetical protein
MLMLPQDWTTRVPLKGSLKQVLKSLAIFADNYGACRNLKINTIANTCGLSVLKTWLAIRKLKALRIIIADSKHGYYYLRLQIPPESLVLAGGK